MRFRRSVLALPKLLLAVLLCGCLAAAQATPPRPAEIWVGTWATSQQIPEPQNALTPDDLHNATLRQIVHLSVGGSILRVHISNAFGTEPLYFSSVHVARPISAANNAIDPASDRALTFARNTGVTVPAGAEYISDPVGFNAQPLSSLAITFHLDSPPAQQTGHPGSRATSYLIHGNLVSTSALPGARKVEHWYQLSGVDVLASPGAASIVALGDSITDGHATQVDENQRWTDVLARRLQAFPQTRNIGVLNQGIGGNHLLTDGLGPNALARFDHDVLAQPGVRYLIVLEGVNDLGGLTRLGDVSRAEHESLVRRIIAAYQQIILRAHSHGIIVIGGTIAPYTGSDYYHPPPSDELDRQAVNRWIRSPGNFDAVVDFDKVMRDPAHPDRLLPVYDSGDHLHPSPAGYRAMAAAIPLALFTR